MNGSLSKILSITVSASAMACVIASSAQAVVILPEEIPDGYSVFEFNVDLGSGNRLVGAFVGDDVNGDRQISSNQFVDLGPFFESNSEVALIRVEYQGPSFDLNGQYDFFPTVDEGFGPDFFNAENGAEVVLNTFVGESQLTYNLDGSGIIGNDTFNFFDAMTLRLGQDYIAAAGLQGIELEDPFGPSGIFQTCPIEPCSGLWRLEPTIVHLDPDGNFSDPDTNPDGEIFIDTFTQETVASNAGVQITSGPVGDAIGVDEDFALLPEGAPGADGGFEFDVPSIIPPNAIFFIDPDVAVGYTYEVEGTVFTAVQAPTLDAVNDPDGYQLVFNDMVIALAPGQRYTFDTPVSSFQILGIDTDLLLDPTDSAAFVTGIALEDPGAATRLAQIPQTVFVGDDPEPAPVPLPATGLLMIGALGGFSLLRRKRARA
ncbi:putative secreted protein [Litoreibacter ponti]|uniref:Putative secreted protein n=1 Tax=Litoreibacter ponti TaxID=1510457 RepID=A0A2T6BEP0_9RHOB|nr:VPLPA-CTERM sorting domain-containing protein [Litoreibacter ponti]PTX54529.1 putative secreted protein [Litoreibacter ponti]